MRVVFTMEKATKNTIRFEEVLESELAAPKVSSIYVPKSTLGESELAAPKIGSVYIPKSTLGESGWKEGTALTIDISVDRKEEK